jgi:hypothetical protein
MFDFHLHSKRSDGQLTPLELARHLAGLNVQAFAITDHNYLSADLLAVRDFAARRQIGFVFGLEISSVDRLTDTSLHMLGYGNNLCFERLNQALQPVRDGYNRRAKNIIDMLNRKYPAIKLDYDRLLTESESSYLDRNRIASALQQYKKDSSTIKELLPEVFVVESDDWLPDTAEVIKLIIACGGYPVLAHPGRLMSRDPSAFERLIDRLATVGLYGLEAYYQSHSAEQRQTLCVMAANNELPVTGGSDWHGPEFSPGKNPGCLLPEQIAQTLLATFSN